MTNYEDKMQMSKGEFAEWLDDIADFEEAPWMKWWDENFCNRCESVIGKMVDSGEEMEFGWCEVYGKCKFFPEKADVPDSVEIIQMWLEEEVQ